MPRILVFFDGSTQSRKGFDLGLEMATRFRADMVVLRVLSTVEIEVILDRKEDYPVRELRHLCNEARGRGIHCQYRADVGDPVERIVRASEDIDASLIMISREPLTETNSTTRGSQAKRTIDLVGCSVTVV